MAKPKTDKERRREAARREGAMTRAVMHPATWNQLHNVLNPRGAAVRRKLEAGHALSSQDLRTLHAAPTASWWSQKDIAMAPSAARHHAQGKVLDSTELAALRAIQTSKVPRTLPSLAHYAGMHQDRGAQTRNRPLMYHESPAQQCLGYKQQIALESTVRGAASRKLLGPFPGEQLFKPGKLEPLESSWGEFHPNRPPSREELHALSAPRLDAPTAAERCAARDCRVAELQANVLAGSG